jgi:hypothetical protein
MGFALCYDLQRDDEALVSFRRATELDPANLPGHVGQLVIHNKRKEWVSAAAAFRAAATLDETIGEEGCQNSNAGAVLSVYMSEAAPTIAKELMRLDRYNDLTTLCVDIQKGWHSNSGWNFSDEKLLSSPRFLPACAAVQAAAGRGINAPPPEDRPRVRRLAFDWLSADLNGCREKLAADPVGLRDTAHTTMKNWLAEPLLDDVRGSRITELPKAEQAGWKRLWEDVAKLRDQTAPKERAPLPREKK